MSDRRLTTEKARELVKRFKQGDQSAFAELVQAYRKPLYYVILKIVNNETDAEDLVTETFIKAYENIDKFDEKYAFSTWLFKIGNNLAIDFLRKKKRSVPIVSLSDKISTGDEDSPTYEEVLKEKTQDTSEIVHYRLEAEHVKKIMNQLPKDLKEILELKYIQELTHQEIANKLNIPIGTVKGRLARARKLLFKLLRRQ